MAELGTYDKRVTFENPGPAVPDGDGGYTEGWVPLTPAGWKVRITPATAADLERTAAGSVVSMASHVVEGAWHPGVTTETRMVWIDRARVSHVFSIVGKVNLEMRSVVMVLGAVEVVT
jgi:hypothetical protein